MESEEVSIACDDSPPPPHQDHPDFSPVGSPESHFLDELPHPPDQPQAFLTDDLRQKIIKQVEYYFSNENLPTDKFLLKFVTKNKEGFVPLGVIASFRKMKKLTRDMSLIVAALRGSSLLVLSSDGKKVKRRSPLQSVEVKDPKLCTVLVENLPPDHSVENLQQLFGEAGKIKSISIRDPNCVKDQRKVTVAEKLLTGKLHALVEYDTVEAAEKAVATLNNEQDWRYGLRVKLLKKASKPGQRKKEWRSQDSEKVSSVQSSDVAGNEDNHHSSDHHDDSQDDEDGEHLQKEKNGNKGRNRGRGRRQRHGTNGHGHGIHSSSHVVEPSKPPPGPRMPDGTRGFTMGRGRPLASSPS